MTWMSDAAKPAARSRSAIASAAFETLPDESVVLISMSCLKISRARASFGPDCALTTADRTTAMTPVRFMRELYATPDILRLMKFAPEYVAYVLNENFEDAKTLLLS